VTRLLVLFVTAFVDMVGLAMIVPLLPFYATEFGANATVVGVLVSAFSVAQLAVAPVWGRFSDRYGRRPAILAGLLISACAYVIFGFAGSVPVFRTTFTWSNATVGFVHERSILRSPEVAVRPVTGSGVANDGVAEARTGRERSVPRVVQTA